MILPRRSTRLARLKGFSAIEVIAVATIIAILALILIPILTKEVSKSRDTAAKDEMSNLAKVITLAFAYTDRYYRLQDYDNPSIYFPPPRIDDPTNEVPGTFYGMTVPMTPAERARIKDKWNGPLTVFHNSATMLELYQSFPNALTIISAGGGGILQGAGPIYAFVTAPLDATQPAPPPPTLDERRDHYPLDPWGNPYFYFPAGAVQIPGVASESVYSPVIFSMGPDGLPGNKTNPTSPDYYPPPLGVLGTGTDDVTWKF